VTHSLNRRSSVETRTRRVTSSLVSLAAGRWSRAIHRSPHLCSEKSRSEGAGRQRRTVEGDGADVAAREQQGRGADLQSFGLFVFWRESVSLVTAAAPPTAAAPLVGGLQGSLPVPGGEVEGLSALVRVLLLLLPGRGAPASAAMGGLLGEGRRRGAEFGRPGGDVGLELGGGRGAPAAGVGAEADDGARLLPALPQGAQQLGLVLQGADAEGGVEARAEVVVATLLLGAQGCQGPPLGRRRRLLSFLFLLLLDLRRLSFLRGKASGRQAHLHRLRVHLQDLGEGHKLIDEFLADHLLDDVL